MNKFHAGTLLSKFKYKLNLLFIANLSLDVSGKVSKTNRVDYLEFDVAIDMEGADGHNMTLLFRCCIITF